MKRFAVSAILFHGDHCRDGVCQRTDQSLAIAVPIRRTICWSHGGSSRLTSATMRSFSIGQSESVEFPDYHAHPELASGDNATSTALDQLRAFVGAGGQVLFGTDVGYMSVYDPADEYALMSESGMTSRQILASLTTAPAERFDGTRSVPRLGRYRSTLPLI
jgi:hypothetical protein